jgi:hypothetical protein
MRSESARQARRCSRSSRHRRWCTAADAKGAAAKGAAAKDADAKGAADASAADAYAGAVASAAAPPN